MTGVATADLVDRARAGDGEAFRRLTGPYRRELQVHCYRMLGSVQDAEDALQETMLAAYHAASSYRAEGTSRAWLLSIARHVCANRIEVRARQARRRVLLSSEPTAA